MKTAKCHVAAPIYVPAGEHLNGEILQEPRWARVGEHVLGADFAAQQEAAGLCEIERVDGVPVYWSACCSGGSHEHS